MKKKLLIFAVGLALALMACAPWKQIGGPYEAPDRHFTVELPQGWMLLDTPQYTMISRDGAFLQYILIQDRQLDRPFRNTRKIIRADMLPEEAAEVVLSDLSADRSIRGLRVQENSPVRIGSHSGFKLRFTYRDINGLAFQTVYYGLIHGNRLITLRYTATERYYFDKDIATFEKVLNSFQLLNASAS